MSDVYLQNIGFHKKKPHVMRSHYWWPSNDGVCLPLLVQLVNKEVKLGLGL